MTDITIEKLFSHAGFSPNESQHNAVVHDGSPLFLIAGPGSGKTRVLLWRTLNLLVFQKIPPEEIFLGTFTEKAALQLKQGLQELLGLASNFTNQSYDLSKMYIGTVHSLCQRLIADRRFSEDRARRKSPVLLDELDQYFLLYRQRFWNDASTALGLPEDIYEQINVFFGKRSSSKHNAVKNCISIFNRFSEEQITSQHAAAHSTEPMVKLLASIYGYYLTQLKNGPRELVDFSLLQDCAFKTLQDNPNSGQVFKHIIIDEYQDTNAIQERIFFSLASGHKNICVVGDDDQALYRFRGATVENFVQFPQRTKEYLSTVPTAIKLNTNYRSRSGIVDFYSDFITRENWVRDANAKTYYRLADKDIVANNKDSNVAVLASTKQSPIAVAEEIAQFVKRLIDEKKVVDPNQIAFLYPSLASEHTTRMKDALERLGLKVYAPRAGRFLEAEEPTKLLGLIVAVVGRPQRGDFGGEDYRDFHDWLDRAEHEAALLMNEDKLLQTYVVDRQQEIKTIQADYAALKENIRQAGWEWKSAYDPNLHKRLLANTNGISIKARRQLESAILDKLAFERLTEGRPIALSYIVNRATSPDWSILDLFYRFCGFAHFKAMFDLAERGTDEGPICNLGLISEYLERYIDKNGALITGSFLDDGKLSKSFVASYLFALFRLGESEYEDAEDPFPKGRVPFLTIHQSKGLEFPIVVLGNPRKNNRGPQKVETVIRPLLSQSGEPLDRIAGFDIMRMFYVALSRAKQLMIIAHPVGRGISIHPSIRAMLDAGVTRIPSFNVATLPSSPYEEHESAKAYSYIADYMLYQRCARQYMVFRKYGFVPSRSQTMFFGSLVHQTIEDLHNRLIAVRSEL